MADRTEAVKRGAWNTAAKMVIFSSGMTISVTDLKARLLEVVRAVERDGAAIDVERHGKLVARIVPARRAPVGARPWELLAGSGVLIGAAEESVIEESDFEAAK